MSGGDTGKKKRVPRRSPWSEQNNKEGEGESEEKEGDARTWNWMFEQEEGTKLLQMIGGESTGEDGIR